MEHVLKIGERDITVVAESLETGAPVTWTVGGDAHEIVLRGALPHGHALVVDSRSTSLYAARAVEGTWVWCRGRARLVRDGAREQRRSGGGPAGAADGAVTPLTPGVVVDVLVDAGQAVDRGQGLVVLSAMKMETTLVAGYAGTVAAVNTEVGAKVMPGEILVEIDPTSEEEKTDE